MKITSNKEIKKLVVGDIVRYEPSGGSGIPSLWGQIARIENIDKFGTLWIRFPWPYFTTISSSPDQVKSATWEAKGEVKSSKDKPKMDKCEHTK